jgi:hypothetical protein
MYLEFWSSTSESILLYVEHEKKCKTWQQTITTSNDDDNQSNNNNNNDKKQQWQQW